jgi:hypothetical protein
MKKEYIKYGTCIWCSKEKPEVTFYDQPHTISKQIGAINIGFDICDSCNSYFGTSDKYQMSIELAFKEIFNVTRYLMPESEKGDNGLKIMRSVYYEYYKSQRVLRIKKRFELQKSFLQNFTRQFKRGVYEVFLQEFHRNTGRALEDKFDDLRKFVRYDRGDLPLYFADNNGIYLLPVNRELPTVEFNDPIISIIDDYGFYMLWLFGHIFYLEVTPKAYLSREIFLKKEAKQIGAPGFIIKGIKEMKYVTELDFALQKLYGIK